MIAYRIDTFSVFEWVLIVILAICCVIGDLITFEWVLNQKPTDNTKRFKNPFKTSKND